MMAYPNSREDPNVSPGLRPLWYPVALAATTVLGVLVRVIGIARYPHLIYDEFYYVPAADVLLRRRPIAVVKNAIPGIDPNLLSHPPLVKELIAAAIYLLGQHPWVWRLPGLLAGCAVPLLIAGIAQTLFRDRVLAAVAALLAAGDGLSIVMSRVALPDSPAVALVLAGLWLSLAAATRVKAGRPVSLGRWLALGVVLGLALAAEWIGGQAILLVWVWFMVGSRRMRQAWRQWLPAVTVLPFLVYYATYFYAWPSGYHEPWLPVNPFIAFFKLQYLMFKDMWTLTFYHPWTANAWSWVGIPRPTAMILSTTATQSVRVMAFSDPLIVWTGIASLLAGGWLVYRRRGNVAPWGYLALWFVCFYGTWLAAPRSKFLYYFTTASLGLDIAAAAGVIMAWRALTAHPRGLAIRSALATWCVVAGLSLLYLLPLWVGLALPRPFYHALWWPPTWNARVNTAAPTSTPSFSLTLKPMVRPLAVWPHAPSTAGLPALPTEWIQFGGTTSHNSAFAGRLTVKSSYMVKLASTGIADAPAISGGAAFVGTTNSQVYAINVANGSVAWAVGVPNSIEATPLVDQGHVVVAMGNSVFRTYSNKLGWIRGTGSNGLMALNAATGSDQWYAPSRGGIMATPVIAGDLIYAVTGASRLIAVNVNTGKRAWSLRLAGFDSTSSPVVVGNHLYVATNQYFQSYPARRSTVWSINLTTHQISWARDVAAASGLSDCTIAVDGPRLFVEGVPRVSAHGQGNLVSQRLFALSRVSGHPLWSRSVGQGRLPALDQQEVGTPLAVGPVVYTGSPASDRVEAWDAVTGRVLWTRHLGTGVTANPILLHNALLVAGNNGRLLWLNAKDGKIVGRDPVNFGALGPASPLIVGRVLLQSTMTGTLAVQRLGH